MERTKRKDFHKRQIPGRQGSRKASKCRIKALQRKKRGDSLRAARERLTKKRQKMGNDTSKEKEKKMNKWFSRTINKKLVEY